MLEQKKKKQHEVELYELETSKRKRKYLKPTDDCIASARSVFVKHAAVH